MHTIHEQNEVCSLGTRIVTGHIRAQPPAATGNMTMSRNTITNAMAAIAAAEAAGIGEP
jgi:hypothetical protein